VVAGFKITNNKCNEGNTAKRDIVIRYCNNQRKEEGLHSEAQNFSLNTDDQRTVVISEEEL
jgi:hypothetical protein